MKHQPVKQGLTTTLGTTCPTLFDKCVYSLTSPAIHRRRRRGLLKLPCILHDIAPSVYKPFSLQARKPREISTVSEVCGEPEPEWQVY